jgi:broad specificity phosphatase PhoE
MNLTIYFLRHGETQAGEPERRQGFTRRLRPSVHSCFTQTIE